MFTFGHGDGVSRQRFLTALTGRPVGNDETPRTATTSTLVDMITEDGCDQPRATDFDPQYARALVGKMSFTRVSDNVCSTRTYGYTPG